METNNKLREALERAKDIARTIYSTSEMGSHHEDLADKIVELANAALAAPVKNCEVGTAKEQSRRFEEYCESEVCKRNRCKSQAKALCIERCALAWAQTPYESEVPK